jgi:hypothetical protein
MTPEARLNRLERITKLIVRAGVRYRRDLRELGDKLNIIINTQIQSEAIFQSRSAKYEKRFKRTEERLTKLSEKTDRKFVELAVSQADTDRRIKELTQSQAQTDRSVKDLIKDLRRDRNGKTANS